MSIQAVGWALEQQLPASAKLVLVAIANHANHVDGYCWLRADTIAHEASCTPRQVYRVASALARNGYLRKEAKKGADGRQRASDYWLLFERNSTEKWSWFDVSDDGDDPQDVVGSEPPPESYSGGRATPESCGPDDSGVTHRMTYESAGKSIAEPSSEPSKPNKTKIQDSDLAVKAGLRSYKPPPPPLDTPKIDDPGKPSWVFVIQGTPAWHAWITHRRAIGRPINGAYGGEGEHKGKTGRHFPSLFPPKRESAKSDGVDEAAAAEFAAETAK